VPAPAGPTAPAPAYPESRLTGQPRRPALVLVACVLCYVACVAIAVTYAWGWWGAIHIDRFHDAARLLQWTHPAPVSWLAVIMVGLVAVLHVVVIGLIAGLAYNAWSGRRWVRIGGIVITLVAAGLAYLLHPWAIAALPLVAVAVILLWLRPYGRYAAAVAAAGLPRSPVTPPEGPTLYGPQPLMGRRERLAAATAAKTALQDAV